MRTIFVRVTNEASLSYAPVLATPITSTTFIIESAHPDFADATLSLGVTVAYVCRLLPLTCLAPDIVEAILDGQQPKGLRLAELLGNGPVSWEEQQVRWG